MDPPIFEFNRFKNNNLIRLNILLQDCPQYLINIKNKKIALCILKYESRNILTENIKNIIITSSNSTNSIDFILKLSNTQIITVTKNGILKIWDLTVGFSIKTILGPKYLMCIEKININKIATGDFMDGSIKIWDCNTGKYIMKIIAHPTTGACCCIVKLNENQLASGGNDWIIKIWDLTNGTCLKTLKGHKSSIKTKRKSIYQWRK